VDVRRIQLTDGRKLACLHDMNPRLMLTDDFARFKHLAVQFDYQ
jgi:hypothetical protein